MMMKNVASKSNLALVFSVNSVFQSLYTFLYNMLRSCIFPFSEVADDMKLDLIVIDSIAGAFRSEFESDKRDLRAHSIHKLGVLVNKIARDLSIPIVVTNQVTAVFDQKQENFGRSILPCFGLSWTCYVHTRMYVGKTGMTVQCDQLNVNKKVKIETSVRVVEVDFCPLLSNVVTNFIVDNAGIRAITINRK